MNFIKDNLILLAMPICLLVVFLVRLLEDEVRAGACREADKDEEEKLNATELGILKVGINYLITDHYANRDILRQSLEELSDKLDRMIGEANKQGG